MANLDASSSATTASSSASSASSATTTTTTTTAAAATTTSKIEAVSTVTNTDFTKQHFSAYNTYQEYQEQLHSGTSLKLKKYARRFGYFAAVSSLFATFWWYTTKTPDWKNNGTGVGEKLAIATRSELLEKLKNPRSIPKMIDVLEEKERIASEGSTDEAAAALKKKKKDKKSKYATKEEEEAVEAEKERLLPYHNAFDVVVVGGGVNGLGVAVIARACGLKVALLETNDFGSGLSSAANYRLHGGSTYLYNVFSQRKRSEFKLARKTLQERAHLYHQAPHLCQPIQVIKPFYSTTELISGFLTLKLHDWFSGRTDLHRRSKYLSSSNLSSSEIMTPNLNKGSFVGSVTYNDTELDDSRFATTLALSAINSGVIAINHITVDGLIKLQGKVRGVTAIDNITGEKINVYGRVVVNATSLGIDSIRKMEGEEIRPITSVTSSTILVFDNNNDKNANNNNHNTSSFGLGSSLLETPELTLMSYKGKIMAHIHQENPVNRVDGLLPTAQLAEREKENVREALTVLNNFLSKYTVSSSTSTGSSHSSSEKKVKLSESNVKSVIKSYSVSKSGEDLSDIYDQHPEHCLNISYAGLITVLGGKYPSAYRRIAIEVMEKILEEDGEIKSNMVTKLSQSDSHKIVYVGGMQYNSEYSKVLAKDFNLPIDVCEHLNKKYGDQSRYVAEIAVKENKMARLHPYYPIIEAEVIHAVRNELALTYEDVLRTRTELDFIDNKVSSNLIPKVEDLIKQAHSSPSAPTATNTTTVTEAEQ